MKIFEEVMEVTDDMDASCGVCGHEVFWVGRVAFVEGREEWLAPQIRIKDMDRVCLCVGPCGHSSLDATDYVYHVTYKK